jgi:hypothetical protein
LYELNKFVHANYNNKTKLTKTSGYLESIHIILGALIPMGKINYIFQKFHLRDLARDKWQEVEILIESLCSSIQKHIGPCPLSMQPVDKSLVAIAASGNSIEDDLVEGVTLVQNGIGNEIPGIGSSEINIDDSRSVISSKSSKQKIIKDSQPVIMKYQWVCRWEISMRSLLIKIEECLSNWVKLENQYREKLTILDRKNMDESMVNYFFIIF